MLHQRGCPSIMCPAAAGAGKACCIRWFCSGSCTTHNLHSETCLLGLSLIRPCALTAACVTVALQRLCRTSVAGNLLSEALADVSRGGYGRGGGGTYVTQQVPRPFLLAFRHTQISHVQAPPRGDRKCAHDCNGVGNCHAEFGYCQCPAGA